MAAPLGNQNGRKAKIWEQALKRALARYSGETVDKGLDRLADRMVKAAMEGDDAASMIVIEKIADRIDGKPVAVQELSGPDGDAVQVFHRIELVPMTDDSSPNSNT